jgi:PAS domain S-box-containing protein
MQTVKPSGSPPAPTPASDRNAEERFRTMADHAPVLLWMSGTDALCNFFNEPWLAFTGRTMEMELGNGWAEGVHAEDFQRCMSTYLSAFVERREFRMEYRLRRADGEYRWVLDNGVPHFGPDGVFAGYIGSCIDITDLKEAREELDRKVLERTAELEAFAYSVSHDLRAPLRAIAGFSEELSRSCIDQIDERGRHYLERISEGAKRMGILMDGLLALSRIARTDLVKGHVNLSGLARDVLKELREREPSRAVDAEITDGLMAKADLGLVRVLLENLLANAWKFTAKKDRARIVVGQQPGRPQAFFVRDDGAGFDMQYSGRLFAPFQRLHAKQDFDGTGIGLATVHRIATRHGGRAWAEGAVGQGATFYFTLEGSS